MNFRVAFVAFVLAVLATRVFSYFQQKRKVAGTTKFKDLNELVAYFANEAVLDAEKENQIPLDFSIASIQKVESILSELHIKFVNGNKSVSAIGLGMAYGMYIGEALRRSKPGSKWEMDHPVVGEKSYPLYWGAGELFPVGWCYKRITNGPDDNVWHKYLILNQKDSENSVEEELVDGK